MMHVVTVATHYEGYLNALEESCQRNHLKLVILGMGQEWKGFSFKFLLMTNYLNTLEDDEIVIFVDAYDVIAIQSSETIKERFLQFQTPILLSVESSSGFWMDYGKRRIFGKCRDTFLNSGMYMGYVYALRKLFSFICSQYDCLSKKFSSLDDQRILTEICSDDAFFDHYFVMDVNSVIFYNIPMNSHYHVIKDNQLLLKKTGMSPCFLHGWGDQDMSLYLSLYNLPSDKKKRHFTELKKFQHFYRFFYMEFFLVCFIILTVVFWIRQQKPNMFRVRSKRIVRS